MTTVTIKQERNNRGIAFIITLIVHAAILLFLFYYVIITPLPPYKEIPPPEVIVEADFGNAVNGAGHVEQNKMGENPNPEKSVKNSPSKVTAQSAPLLTNDADEPSNLKSPKKPVKTEKIDTVSAPQQQVSPELAGVFNKFRHSKGGTPGGDGNSGQAGNAGVSGGTNPGESMGTEKFGYQLNMDGRGIVIYAKVSADCHVEGTIVVSIIVDQSGKVVSAIPGVKGSNNTNSCLEQKAKEAAMATKISASPNGNPEQQGTITVVFTIQ